MVLKITKETWEKCGIKTIEHYNKKEDMIELWNKMKDIKIQTNHTNIYNIALERIRKYCGKKQKTLQKKKNKNIKHFLKVKQVLSLLKNLTRDIIERC